MFDPLYNHSPFRNPKGLFKKVVTPFSVTRGAVALQELETADFIAFISLLTPVYETSSAPNLRSDPILISEPNTFLTPVKTSRPRVLIESGEVTDGPTFREARKGATVIPCPKCPLCTDRDPGSQNPFGNCKAPPAMGDKISKEYTDK